MTNFDPVAIAPAELQEYFATASALRSEELDICPLSRAAASAYSADIQATSIGASLGLVALEGANNSEPHCYITRGPAVGMVMQFNRGDAYSLRFPSLGAFVQALKDARKSRTNIEDIPAQPIPPVADQASLSARLIAALSVSSSDSDSEIEVLLPCLAPSNTDVLVRLSESDSVLVREYVAVFVDRNPTPAHEEISSRLSKDKSSQVAEPARSAAKKIRRLKWEQRGDA
jgi:hypothetical protein